VVIIFSAARVAARGAFWRPRVAARGSGCRIGGPRLRRPCGRWLRAALRYAAFCGPRVAARGSAARIACCARVPGARMGVCGSRRIWRSGCGSSFSSVSIVLRQTRSASATCRTAEARAAPLQTCGAELCGSEWADGGWRRGGGCGHGGAEGRCAATWRRVGVRRCTDGGWPCSFVVRSLLGAPQTASEQRALRRCGRFPRRGSGATTEDRGCGGGAPTTDLGEPRP